MMTFRPDWLIKSAAGLGLSLVLAACAPKNDLDKPPVPLGQFALGLNIVVGETAQTVPVSRQATAEQWKTAMTKAMADRFGRYTGDKLYDFGISIDGYELAPPGVPVVAAPKSVLIATVNVWDDASQTLLNPGGKRLTVIEGISPASIFGSGWSMTKQQQLDQMSYLAALAVQNYLLDNPEWFGLPPKSAETAAPAPTVTPPANPPAPPTK